MQARDLSMPTRVACLPVQQLIKRYRQGQADQAGESCNTYIFVFATSVFYAVFHYCNCEWCCTSIQNTPIAGAIDLKATQIWEKEPNSNKQVH
eukprot:1033242-Amphidinium_carterae.1